MPEVHAAAAGTAAVRPHALWAPWQARPVAPARSAWICMGELWGSQGRGSLGCPPPPLPGLAQPSTLGWLLLLLLLTDPSPLQNVPKKGNQLLSVNPTVPPRMARSEWTSKDYAVVEKMYKVGGVAAGVGNGRCPVAAGRGWQVAIAQRRADWRGLQPSAGLTCCRAAPSLGTASSLHYRPTRARLQPGANARPHNPYSLSHLAPAPPPARGIPAGLCQQRVQGLLQAQRRAGVPQGVRHVGAVRAQPLPDLQVGPGPRHPPGTRTTCTTHTTASHPPAPHTTCRSPWRRPDIHAALLLQHSLMGARPIRSPPPTHAYRARVHASTQHPPPHHFSHVHLLASTREVQLHAKLQHANIIGLYGAFQQDGQVVLVQEFADGGDLFTLLHRQAPARLPACLRGGRAGGGGGGALVAGPGGRGAQDGGARPQPLM